VPHIIIIRRMDIINIIKKEIIHIIAKEVDMHKDIVTKDIDDYD
jgi:hypothetical protein